MPLAVILAAVLSLPSHDNVTRIIVTGDTGATHSRLRAGILRVQKKTPIDAIVLVGDNFYPCGITSEKDEAWSKVTQHFGPAHVPIFPILGNHDYGDPGPNQKPKALCSEFASNPGAEVKATVWQFPSRSYVLRNAAAEVVMFDSEPLAMGWTTPYLGSETSAVISTWLHDRLEESSGKWRIVVGHHTIYSSGMHGRTNGADQTNMRALLPLLSSEHVDLYICGHDHDMELLGDLQAHDEPLFLVSGSGSGLGEMKPRKAKVLAEEPPTLWPSPIVAMHGFAVVEISPSELAITFYDQSGSAQSKRFVMKK
jgi:tartrate-resistant acid phosphatase type 5